MKSRALQMHNQWVTKLHQRQARESSQHFYQQMVQRGQEAAQQAAKHAAEWAHKRSQDAAAAAAMRSQERERSKSPLYITTAQPKKPSAVISKTWATHNVKHKGELGMFIHVKFEVANLLDRTGTVAAYFYFSNGVPLKDINDAYNTTKGNVSVHRRFTAPYAETVYDYFDLFMPYDELHMAPGTFSLKFSVSVWDDRNEQIATVTGPSFTFTSGPRVS